MLQSGIKVERDLHTLCDYIKGMCAHVDTTLCHTCVMMCG